MEKVKTLELERQETALEQLQTQAQDQAQQARQAQVQATEESLQDLQDQKTQARQAYEKEQAAAWVDYQRQSARHGAEEEALAQQGLGASGYAESSRVAHYTAYQNRVAAAREGLHQAALAYDRAMEQARSQGNAALAQIALEALELQLRLELEAFDRSLALAREAEEQRQFDLEYALKLEKLQPQASGSTAGKKPEAAKPSLAQPMEEAQIRQLQKYLGAPPTGRWDATTQAAAESRGLGDARAVLEAMELADGDHVLDTYPKLGNRQDGEGFYIGQRRYTWQEAEALLAQGLLERTDYGNGTYRYHLPLKPKA